MNDVKMLDEMLASSREILNETEKLYNSTIENYGFNKEFASYIVMKTEDEIRELTLNNINDLLTQYNIDNTDVELKYSKSFEKDKPYLEYIKDKLLEIKVHDEEYKKELEDLHSLETQVHKLKEDLINYVRSPEYKESKRKNVERLKELAENEIDEIKKKKYLDQLSVIENVESSRFLIERLEKYGKKEVDSLVEVFFDRQKSEYTMKKWVSVCKKLKLSNELYQYFFNIEENHLPKEYHIYNNLFLFICIRYISYCNPDVKSDKMYVMKTINNLAHLIYHDFDNSDDERKYLDLIMEIEDYFVDYKEKFENDNATHPEHPVRIKQMEEFKKSKKNDLIKEILSDESNEYSEEELYSMDYDQLVTIQEEKMAKSLNESNKEIPVTSGYVSVDMGDYEEPEYGTTSFSE